MVFQAGLLAAGSPLFLFLDGPVSGFGYFILTFQLDSFWIQQRFQNSVSLSEKEEQF